jgi:energy-coupling factor transporter ATP-binding protein EcfA2
MQIEEILIKGYKRFSLNSIELFKYNPKKKIQLILGSNGSGKSSLIKELSPLPAEPNEYSKDGCKHVTYNHNNSIYILKSDFAATGNKFSFVKDGEELNPGHTVTVYKELVKKEFNITPDVHGLMTGRVKFSRMSVSERRKWFTQIADSDYTFAIGFYMKLKEQYRDIQGAIKLQQARLVQESSKLPTPEEQQNYKQDINHLNTFLDHLLSQSDQSVVTAATLEAFEQIQTALKRTALELIEEKAKFPNADNFTDEEALKEAVISVKTRIRANESLLHAVYQDMDEQSKSISALEEYNLSSFQDVDKSIDDTQLEITTIERQLKFPILSNPDAGLAALTSVKPQLDDYLTEMIKHAGKGYDKTTYTTCLDTQNSLTNKLQNSKFANDKLLLQLKEYDHAKKHNKIDCPNCKHTWFLGFSQNLYDECSRAKELLDRDIPSTEMQLKILEAERTDQYEYLTTVSNFLKLMGQVQMLEPFWKYLINTGLLKTEPVTIRKMVQEYVQELNAQQTIALLHLKLIEFIKIKKITAENQSNDLAALKIKFNKLEVTAQDYQMKIRKDVVREESLLSMERAIKNIHNKHQQLERLIADQAGVKSDIEKTMKQEFIGSCIRLTKSEIAQKSQIVSRIDIHQALVTSIEKQIAEYHEQAVVYKIMLKELSPSEGLIAKGLINFINHFVIQMNSYIKKIWLYPLEIQPIFQMDDELELDYKFQLKVNDKADISDVSLGSSAMKEVIDLAFMKVSMKYLKLDKAPLFLDEFSVNMDSAHRKSAFNTVTDLMTNSNHSQVFLISHYEDSYGSIANADVTVLCSNNVVIPKGCGYNNCVEFK